MWRRTILWILVGLAACAGAAVLYGASRWRRGTDQLHAWLHAARAPIAPAAYHPRELEGLPPPVERYFRTKEGQPIIAAARFTHTGTFNMGETTPNWRPFSSTQIVTTRRPGFDWDGRVQLALGVLNRSSCMTRTSRGKVSLPTGKVAIGPPTAVGGHEFSYRYARDRAGGRVDGIERTG